MTLNCAPSMPRMLHNFSLSASSKTLADWQAWHDEWVERQTKRALQELRQPEKTRQQRTCVWSFLIMRSSSRGNLVLVTSFMVVIASVKRDVSAKMSAMLAGLSLSLSY